MTLKTIREGKCSKIIASYLAVQLFIQMTQPSELFALTSGPSQPEFNSFTPIGTSDMVNLSSGDFNYNLPVMDVGGYPLNLSYQTGITMDQEASWVGLGWNLNVGQIARDVRGIPDDFKGDEIKYQNDARDSRTVGITLTATPSIFGKDKKPDPDAQGPFSFGSVGLGIQYNNFSGVSFTPMTNVSYNIAGMAAIGGNFSLNATQGPTVGPSVGANFKRSYLSKEKFGTYSVSPNVGLGLGSRQGIQNLNLQASTGAVEHQLKNPMNILQMKSVYEGGGSQGSAVSFDDQSFTPRKRVGMNSNSFTFNASIAPTIFGFQVLTPQTQGTAFGSFQGIKDSEKDKDIPTFGYENTEAGNSSTTGAVLDFNRRDDRTVNKNTNVLPVTQYSYDMYSIQGQGIGGAFRPYRGQVGYIYDNTVSDNSDSGTLGIEFGAGQNWYSGFEVKLTDENSASKKWTSRNYALPKFEENENDDNTIDYEKTYFKTYGNLEVDQDIDLYNDDLYGETPIRFEIEGSKYNRRLTPKFEQQVINGQNIDYISQDDGNTEKIKREMMRRRR